MVCNIANGSFEERVVTTEVNESSRGLGDHDEAA